MDVEINFVETQRAINDLNFTDIFDKQLKMCDLSFSLKEPQRYLNPAIAAIECFDIDDQLILLQFALNYANLCKQLCEKYNLKPKEENDNGEI